METHPDPLVLIERSYPLVYYLSLSILDDPVEAGAVTRATGLIFIDVMQVDPRQVLDPAWLYRHVVVLCRERLRFGRYLQRLPDSLRSLLGLREAPQCQPAPESGSQTAWTVCQMDEELRLPLILRYAHDLPPYEIARVLGWKDELVLARLSDARQRLRPFWGESAVESDDSFNHEQAQSWVEAAANQAITDNDTKSLARHLKSCARCQEYAARLTAQEDDLRTAFRARWGSADIPTPPAFVEEVTAAYRRRRSLRRTLSLAGAALFTLVLMILILFLSDRIVPATRLPAIPVSATPATIPTLMAPVSNGDLLDGIYPGKIVYVAFNLSNHLFTIQPVSKEVRQLTLGFTENAYPAWSPDGSQIAYLSIPEGWGLNQIMSIQADGGGSQLISHSISRPDFPRSSLPPTDSQNMPAADYPLYGPPHWSPDGKSLASVVWVSPEETFLGIFSLSDGSPRYLVTGRLDRSLLDWSPDGRSIAYVNQNEHQVWVWEPDQLLVEETNPRRVGQIVNWDWLHGLAWSPDSERLAIWGGHDYDGRAETNLALFTRSGELDQWNPITSGAQIRKPVQMAWSPDGRYLALLSVFEENGISGGGQVLLASANGRNLHALLEMRNPINSLVWSPDSHWLAYSSAGELWAASLAAYEQSQDFLLLLKPSAGVSLSWQPILHP